MGERADGEWSWLYAAIDTESKLILDVALFGRHGTDPAVAFLHKLREKHDLSNAEFFVDQFSYRTAVARLGLNGRVNYTDRNLVKMWVDRFHNSWVGSQTSVREWLKETDISGGAKLDSAQNGTYSDT